MKRAEIDRLRAELQKSEDNLAAAESEVEKQTAIVGELNRCGSLGTFQFLYHDIASLQEDRRTPAASG
jgi:hypothetical protein